jgi:hypothetical protein
MTINAKTAKSLGLDVPLFLQQRADEVIEYAAFCCAAYVGLWHKATFRCDASIRSVLEG